MNARGVPASGDGLATRIAGIAGERAGDVVATDVRIGLAYTAVRLADGRAGVAYTFRDAVTGCCSALQASGPLVGRTAGELVSLASSGEPIEAAVGLAAVNALTNDAVTTCLEGDVLDHLGVGRDDDVGMVGHFQPLVAGLEKRARSLTIFERLASPNEGVRPSTEAPAALSHCHVAVITATTLLNGTIDGLLEAARSCREVVVLGASTPLLPRAFADTGVTLLSGVHVTDPATALRIVSEGGGMREFKPHVRKLSLRVNPDESGWGQTKRSNP